MIIRNFRFFRLFILPHNTVTLKKSPIQINLSVLLFFGGRMLGWNRSFLHHLVYVVYSWAYTLLDRLFSFSPNNRRYKLHMDF